MKHKINSFLWIILIVLFSATMGVAQEFSRDFDFEDDFDSKFRFWDRPMISIHYGVTEQSLDGLNNDLTSTGFMELNIGYNDLKKMKDGILDYDASYFSISNFTTDIGSEAEDADIDIKTWRVGVNFSTGYAYDLGKGGAIIPYNSSGLMWSVVKLDDSFSIDTNDVNVLNLWHDEVRFGGKTEGGIKIRFIPNIEFDVSYERSMVFRRHLVWYWLGSFAIEQAVTGVIDQFVDRILENTPVAVPVVSFVLKSAWSYAAYELRKEEMYFPFGGEAPLMQDTYKFGVTFVF